nr:hypothetical protein [Tanacetum cinerariifolium]
MHQLMKMKSSICSGFQCLQRNSMGNLPTKDLDTVDFLDANNRADIYVCVWLTSSHAYDELLILLKMNERKQGHSSVAAPAGGGAADAEEKKEEPEEESDDDKARAVDIVAGAIVPRTVATNQRQRRTYEAYEQFQAVTNQEAEGSGSGIKRTLT